MITNSETFHSREIHIYFDDLKVEVQNELLALYGDDVTGMIANCYYEVMDDGKGKQVF